MARNGYQVSNAIVAILAVLLCTVLEHGCYADDVASPSGYDQYYDYLAEYGADAVQDCTVDQAGKVQMADGAVCDIRVDGVDKQADLLPGGIDGVYKLFSCQDGKPAFLRHNSPTGEERVLWWSRAFGDWDISRGSSPNAEDILMYGGEPGNDLLPLSVKDWNLGGDVTSSADKSKKDVYVPITATISCADGQVYEMAAVQKPVEDVTTEKQTTA